MKLNFHQKFLFVCVAVFLGIRVLAEEAIQQTAAPTNDTTTSNLLQIQEQLHATELAIQQNQLAAAEAVKSNSDLLAARLQSLEQTVATQRNSATTDAHKTQQLTLLLAGVFGLAVLGIMLLMVYLQSRAFTQLAQISSKQHAALTNATAIQQLAAPGRATVETSNTRLLDAVEQLKERINGLENSQPLLPQIPNGKPKVNGAAANPLAEGQKYLDENSPQKALEFFDQFLSAHPGNAEALLRKADALEKLGRADDALSYYNRAIAADSTLAVAHLHKGGLLNRLRRYDEALNCYEQALQAQEKKATEKV
jgi:tetratricopeptide (TPR) repeat protein